LKAVAAQRIADGQDELLFGVPARQEPVSLEITSSRIRRLLDAVASVYRQLGLDKVCGGDVVFEQLVTARIIEPTSKQDAARVLAEARVRALSSRTVKRRLPVFCAAGVAERLSGACVAAAALGPSALVLYEMTTLWFETDTGDGFREPGLSKDPRLDPQITVGLLTDATGMPLMIDVFEGNRAENEDDDPAGAAVRGRARNRRGDRGRRRRHAEQGQPGRHRVRRLELHHRPGNCPTSRT
jgi:hypothetical protein